jgi:hypothetical protein
VVRQQVAVIEENIESPPGFLYAQITKEDFEIKRCRYKAQLQHEDDFRLSGDYKISDPDETSTNTPANTKPLPRTPAAQADDKQNLHTQEALQHSTAYATNGDLLHEVYQNQTISDGLKKVVRSEGFPTQRFQCHFAIPQVPS